ncbi:MAG: hypothetical protein Q9157_005810 [Trypethelium eluteriae]
MASRDEDLKMTQDSSSTRRLTLMELDVLTHVWLIAGRATTSAQNRASGPDDKLEDDLELRKDSKVSTKSADEVAGRKGKGTGVGLLEKLVPGKHGKEEGK